MIFKRNTFKLKRIIKVMVFILILSSFTGCSKEKKTDDNIENTENIEQGTENNDETLEPISFTSVAIPSPKTVMLEAKSVILVEPKTRTILFEKNSKEKIYPASMTKIVTALVALDYLKEDELIKVGREINEVSLDSSKAGHVVGETITFKNLLRGLIIPSGNDSANVIAMAVANKYKGGSGLSFNEGMEIFSDLMNKKAKELGAVNSNFITASGYHDKNHYTCAYDMALFADEYLNNPLLADIAKESSFVGDGVDARFDNDGNIKTQKYIWKSHNLLITDNEYNYSYATGIKTGFTDEAGDCLAASAVNNGEVLIAIISDSKDPMRWVDAKNLLEFGYNEFEKVSLAKADESLDTIDLVKQNKLKGDKLDVVIKEPIEVFLPIGNSKPEIKVSYDERLLSEKNDEIKLKAPISKNEKVGMAEFFVNGIKIKDAEVVASREVEKATLISDIEYFFNNFKDIVFSLRGLVLIGILIILVILVIVIRKIVKRKRSSRQRGYTFKNMKKRRRF